MERTLVNKTLSIIAVLAIVGILGAWRFRHASESVNIHQSVAESICPKRTVAQNFLYADAVMTGSVTGVLPVGDVADVWIEPGEIYKGHVTEKNIKIAARQSINTNLHIAESPEDLHFQSVDPPYLLFLKLRSDGRYDTSRCFGSRELGSGLTIEEESVLKPQPPETVIY